MKVAIAKEGEETEAVMNLYLKKYSDILVVCAYDRHGRDWAICEITKSGLKMVSGIPSDTGWPLDSDGCVKLVE